ncbi:MAG: energy-coupling factor transporter transmembrane component T [Bryobacterales bacterium]|nr:energy-coupling factor transporter transmembrane component T [Bryobacterales bacterium]
MHSHSQHGTASEHPAAAPEPRSRAADLRVELVAVLLAIAIVGSEPLGQLRAFSLYIPLVVAFVLFGERSLWPALRRVLPVTPLLAMLALGFPLSRALDAWMESGGGGSASMEPAGWTAAALVQAGWAAAASLFLRALCAITLLSSLVQMSGFARILTALRRMGLPLAVVLTLQHLERYRSLIAEEWRRTNQAREARSPGGLRFAFASYANQTSLIFLRSWERSERIHSAMVSRGFRIDAPLPAAAPSPGFAWWRILWLPAFALLIRLAV